MLILDNGVGNNFWKIEFQFLENYTLLSEDGGIIIEQQRKNSGEIEGSSWKWAAWQPWWRKIGNDL